MNVLNISVFSAQKAGVIAYNYHDIYKRNGWNSKLLMLKGKKIDKDIHTMYSPAGLIKQKIIWKIRKLISKPQKEKTNYDYYFFDFDENQNYFEAKDILKKVKEKPDLIILYFTHKFITARTLYELSVLSKAPIFWIMPDMGPMTGGCHYIWDCEGYKNECGKCPALFSDDEHDYSYKNLKLKKELFSSIDLTIFAASEWTFKRAKQSSVFKDKDVRRIFSPVDSELFKPIDKAEARKALNLPLDKKIIFFGAVLVHEKRKGMSYLIKALEDFQKMTLGENILLLIAGINNPELFASLTFDYKYIGMLNNNEMPLAYQAADVFACPSIEDSGPMMINQSMMCGTPVVSFEMGVAFDLVHNYETGYRAKLMDDQDFANGLSVILNLNKEQYNKMSEKCREMAMKTCHPQLQFERVSQAYETHKRGTN